MKSIHEIATSYNEGEFGRKYAGSRFMIDKRISAVWWMGNNYQNASKYYGAYPPMYLKRIESMFPYSEYRTLHLFSGSLKKGPYTRLDSNPKMKPDVIGNAEDVLGAFEGGRYDAFDLILADPPYRDSDADRYGCKLPNKKRVVESCYDVLNVGGYLVWLDEILPMYRKTMWDVVGLILVVRSTNHRVRMATIFQKRGQ